MADPSFFSVSGPFTVAALAETAAAHRAVEAGEKLGSVVVEI